MTLQILWSVFQLVSDAPLKNSARDYVGINASDKQDCDVAVKIQNQTSPMKQGDPSWQHENRGLLI